MFDSVGLNLKNRRTEFSKMDTALVGSLRVIPMGGKEIQANPYFVIKDGRLNNVPDTIVTQGLAITLSKVTGPRSFEIGVKESSKLMPFVALKVLKFPMINLVWWGTVIMIIGFVMSVRRRWQRSKS